MNNNTITHLTPTTARSQRRSRTAAMAMAADLAANLVKERLDAWIPSVLDTVNAHVDPHLTEAEVRADYRWTCRSRGTVDCADGTAISNQTDDPAASGSHGVDEGRTR